MYLWAAHAAERMNTLFDPSVDTPALFERAKQRFAGSYEPLRIVAASPERALFVARDQILKRRVALRVHLQPDSPSRTLHSRETELLAQLDHPVLRPVYAAGTIADWDYRVSKWIEGESISEAVARGPRPVPAVLQMARELTHVLQYVHLQGIVVRRITPTSVLLEASARAVLIDLRYANVCLDVGGHAPPDDADQPFLAPEIRDGAAGEPASDIYAVGALLYFAVTGEVPAVGARDLRSPRELRSACPAPFERLILRALEPEMGNRYFTAAEMHEDLTSSIGEVSDPLVYVDAGYDKQDPDAWEKRLRRALGDDYELLRELGSGGFGRVYLVRDLALERETALKVLHPYLTADPAVVERFQREARTAAQLVHPNIVDVYDIGGRTGLQWYTMEYVHGASLDRIVAAEGALTLDRVMRLLAEGLDALEHAHGKKLVHRDIKPENLLLESGSGTLRVADFGLAVALGDQDRYGGASSRSGTPAFAAPEQLLGEGVDHRADLYSLTLSAYFALSGTPPFEGGTPESVLARQTVGRLPKLLEIRADVPKSLEAVLRRGAAPEPGDRFPDALTYAQALRDAVRDTPAALRRVFANLFGDIT